MILHFDGYTEFQSKKDIVEYISLFHSIEYKRDVSSLENAIDSTDILQEPYLELAGKDPKDSDDFGRELRNSS